MRPQDVPTDPSATADRVREVLAQPEFRYEKSWLERVGEWIGERLEGLFDRLGVGAPTGAFGGGAGSLVAWLIIVVALAAVIATVVYVVRNRVRKPERDGSPAVTSEIEHRNPASHWAAEAQRHESAGEWKLALRCRYRELVRTLVDRRQLPDVAGRTTGELRPDLHRSTPGADDAFDRATLLFELAWYADSPTGEVENRSFRAAASEVLGAPPDRRYDSGGSIQEERNPGAGVPEAASVGPPSAVEQ